MNKITSIIILCVITMSINAQQRTVLSTYVYNGLTINPAYAGSLNEFSAIVTNREQWINIDGSPSFQVVTAHASIAKHKVGVGLQVNRDVIGIHEQLSVYTSSVYKLRTEKGILSMGLQFGFDNRTSDFTKIEIFDATDTFLQGAISKLNPNFGTGIYFANRTYFIGASAPYILKSKISNLENSKGVIPRHYYINGGYVFNINPKLNINPSFLLRFVENIPPKFDLNVNFIIDNMVYLGMSYRHKDAMALMTQIVLNENFRLGYAHDIPLGSSSGFNAASIEFMINYRIRIKLDKKDGLCPVYY